MTALPAPSMVRRTLHVRHRVDLAPAAAVTHEAIEAEHEADATPPAVRRFDDVDLTAASLDSAALLRGHKTVQIEHNGFVYKLQATRLGKLILTK